MTPDQKRLMKLQGTPEQFKNAVDRAYCDLFVTMQEAERAIRAYRRAWAKAGKKLRVPIKN